MKDFGVVRPGSTLYIEFDSFGANGESLTLTGLDVTDVEVYKNGGTTQRASDNGYALLDTDGIDFDGVTGVHGFSIDLADNSTSGFWTAGAHYRVVVSSVTINSQTVAFTAATFRIGYVGAMIDTTIASLSSQTSFTLTAGPAEDDALNGCEAIIHDIASAVQCGRAIVADYTGSTKTVTLVAGTTFTAAAGDNISVFLSAAQPTVQGRTIDVAATGEVGLDFNNVLSSALCTLHSLTVTGSLTVSDGLLVSRSTANQSAIVATGNGTGHGGLFTSGAGASGDGWRSVAASTNGAGASHVGSGNQPGVRTTGGVTGQGWLSQGGATSGAGIQGTAAGSGAGIAGFGGGANPGMALTGGATGSAVDLTGGATSGKGINIATTDGHGIDVAAAGSAKVDINADLVGAITGNITGNLSGSVGSVTGNVGGNVAGSVGSVTAAVTLPTIPNNWITAAGINADAITAAKVAPDVHQETIELAFTYDATATYAGADAGSLVKQIADNAGGSALTEAGIAETVAEYLFSHDTGDTFGDAVAGSVVKEIADNAGGSALTVEAIADEVQTRTIAGVTLVGTTTDLTNLPAAAATAAELAKVPKSDSNVTWNATALASIQTKTNDALVANHLDHLIGAADPGGIVANSSLWAALTSKSGTPSYASYNNTTDALEALRDRGDAAWITATGFSTHSAADVWTNGTRTLTAGTNIVLAKGTGVTGLNDLSAAQVNAEADTALADAGVTTTVTGRMDAAISTRASQTSVDDLPTNSELSSALASADDAVLAAVAGLNNPSAAQVAAAVLAAGDVDGYTLEQTLKLCLAALAGKLTGAATTTIVIRAADDSKTRITATVDDDGNRSAVTYDAAG